MPNGNAFDRDEFEKLLGYGKYAVSDPTMDLPNSSPVDDYPTAMQSGPDALDKEIAMDSLGDSMEEQAPQRMPANQPQRPPVPSDSDLVKNDIKKRYGFGPGLDAEALKNAQHQSNLSDLFANIGQASQNLGSAIGRATQKPDSSFYDNMRAQSNKPVEDVLRGRQEFLQNNALQKQQELDNPDAPSAAIYRNFLKSALGKEIPPGLSINQMKMLEKPAEIGAQVEGRRETAKLRADLMNAKNRETADAKIDKDQQKADSELGAKMATLGGRGINKSYAEAVRRGENLKGLLDRYKGNLNAMPQQQVDLAVEEMSGLIQGGAPTIASSHTLGVKTLPSQFNAFLSKVGNKPEGAQLGAFLKENIPYVEEIIQKGKAHLKREKSNLVDSYSSRLSPDARQRYKQQLDEEFGDLSGQQSQFTFSDPEKEKRYQQWKASQK